MVTGASGCWKSITDSMIFNQFSNGKQNQLSGIWCVHLKHTQTHTHQIHFPDTANVRTSFMGSLIPQPLEKKTKSFEVSSAACY